MIREILVKILKPVAEIRAGERLKTAVMFGYFFLTISLIYILKPVRNALFLTELGAKNLRYVYIGEGIFLIFVVAAIIWLSKKMSRRSFYISLLFFFASNLVLFWFLFRAKIPYLSAYFYIWVAAFSITMTTQFWMLANDIFKPEEAKRLFGLIISGGSAGGICGGLMTSQLVHIIPAESLLLVAAGIVVGCALFVAAFWKSIYTVAEETPAPVQEKSTQGSGGKLLLGSSYLLMLALLVIFAKMSSTIIDNQFNRMVELTYIGKEARTAFLASFMSWLNVASFVAQLFLTGWCLRYLGTGVSLRILPIGLALFCFGTVWSTTLLAALLLQLFVGSVSYSIQQASKEVLFLPLTSQVRYRVKPVIDMLGFRMAKSLSGIYIALAAPLLGLPDEKLGVLVMILIPLWLFLVWRVSRVISQAEEVA